MRTILYHQLLVDRRERPTRKTYRRRTRGGGEEAGAFFGQVASRVSAFNKNSSGGLQTTGGAVRKLREQQGGGGRREYDRPRNYEAEGHLSCPTPTTGAEAERLALAGTAAVF